MKSMKTFLTGTAIATMAMLSACAGGKASKGLPSDAPEWVEKTSYVDGRSMFAVGLSAGVQNAGLARKRAANQARNELAKLMNTYSASLMKDYAASISTGDLSNPSEEQLVESVVKTYTAELLVGAEVRSYWQNPNDKTVYALAELNLDKRAQIAALKVKNDEQGGQFSEWVKDNGARVLNSLEGETRQRAPAPAPAPTASAESAGGTPAPAPAPAPAAGSNLTSCDDAAYLCATGQGPDRDQADVAARAELARIFESNIQSVAQSYASAAQTISSKTGEQWVETQQFSEQSLVKTDKVVRMSRILGRWVEGATHNSLVGIDRAQAASDLAARIAELDGVVTSQMDQAKAATDAIQRLKNARKAVEAFVSREALNSDLRVVRRDGRGIPAPTTMSDLLALLQDVNRSLKLGIALAGPGSESMQGCLEEALTNKDYEVQSKADEGATSIDIDGEFDVLVSGRLRATYTRAGRNQVAKLSLRLRLVNAKTNKVLKTINASRKGTRPNREAALNTAAVQLCKKQVPNMIKAIDRYFVK